MSLYLEDNTWVALDSANLNKTISISSSEANATLTRTSTAGTGVIELTATVDCYVTVTQGTDETAATANSYWLKASTTKPFPWTHATSISVSGLRDAVDGTLHVCTRKLA